MPRLVGRGVMRALHRSASPGRIARPSRAFAPPPRARYPKRRCQPISLERTAMANLPAETDAGLIGYMFVAQLADLLVEREILSRDDIDNMLQRIVSELDQSITYVHKSKAKFIRDYMLNNKPLE